MISFVSHGAGLLSKNFVKLCFTKFLLRSPAECPANRNIIFVCTVFFVITYKITTCERTLIYAPSAPEKAPQNLRHYANETMDTYLISVKLEQVNTYISNTNNQI